MYSSWTWNTTLIQGGPKVSHSLGMMANSRLMNKQNKQTTS